jgi:hypothetical protein
MPLGTKIEIWYESEKTTDFNKVVKEFKVDTSEIVEDDENVEDDEDWFVGRW